MFGKYRQPYRGPRGRVVERSGSEIVAILLAGGVATALNVLVLASLYIAIGNMSNVSGGLSENATQVLTGWGGGMLGVLGAYVGYTFGKQADNSGGPPDIPDVEDEPPPPPRPPEPPRPPRPPDMPRPPLHAADQPKQMPPAAPGTQGPGSGPPR